MHYNQSNNGDTIVAISTPVGEGGIGIIRLSGRDAFAIVQSIFTPRKKSVEYPLSHRLYYGYIKNANDENIDEVLVSFMRAPGTYTREDIVEINCHSGVVALKLILEMVLEKGARLAEPGEFTKLAYLNGRIDLSQAESVLNLITARSEKAIKNAAKLVKGELSSEIINLRNNVLSIIAQIEATLDFPEEVEIIEVDALIKDIKVVNAKIENLYMSAEKGSIFQNGLRVSIVGKPNVGKSSLLNSILQKQRAIVTEFPGTTRDILEEQLNLKGIPICLIDTAGIRETLDPIEKLGVNLSREAIEASDLVLFMMDASVGIEAEDREIIEIINKEGKKYIAIINKIDLNNIISDKELKDMVNNDKILTISVNTKIGLDELEETIVSIVEGSGVAESNNLMIANIRHKEALFQAMQLLHQALLNVENKTMDVVSIDLRLVEEILREITGEKATDDILDQIFAKFCIGK